MNMADFFAQPHYVITRVLQVKHVYGETNQKYILRYHHDFIWKRDVIVDPASPAQVAAVEILNNRQQEDVRELRDRHKQERVALAAQYDIPY
jgi:hypothetical protein